MGRCCTRLGIVVVPDVVVVPDGEVVPNGELFCVRWLVVVRDSPNLDVYILISGNLFWTSFTSAFPTCSPPSPLIPLPTPQQHQQQLLVPPHLLCRSRISPSSRRWHSSKSRSNSMRWELSPWDCEGKTRNYILPDYIPFFLLRHVSVRNVR